MSVNIKELKSVFAKFKEKTDLLKNSLDIENKEKELAEINFSLNDSEVWSDSDKMTSLNKQKRVLENSLELFRELIQHLDDFEVLIEFAEADEVSQEELDLALNKITSLIEKLEFRKMLGGKMDANNAILEINAGAGGRESQDWAVMLQRMYVRWAERKGFSVEITDLVTGDDAAGIKSVSLIISGDYAYGYLKAETGVHRLVRISPFDSNKRRHTSFSSVFVLPEIDDSIDIEIEEKDLKIDTYRASGAGGQHVNTTDSAVRITHLPTNTVAQCQNERSQHKNKATAMKILRSRLYELELKKKMKDISDKESQKMGIDFGSQIRSYVLHPYKMVKDHRTNFETGNAEAVLNGDEILDKIMENFLLKSEEI